MSKKSKSGVKLADDFRENLIIDRYDPELVFMRASKVEYMRSENSEDAITWNVFRSFRQIEPQLWYSALFAKSFPSQRKEKPKYVTVQLWPKRKPPLSLTAAGIREGASEVDVVIETPSDVWFIEAKYKSDISARTKYGPTRNQIIRNIDVGSWYAGPRDFWFSLLILDEAHGAKGKEIMQRYKADRARIFADLKHRTDGLKNLREIGVLTWSDTASILQHCAGSSRRAAEREFAQRALNWVFNKGITLR